MCILTKVLYMLLSLLICGKGHMGKRFLAVEGACLLDHHVSTT